MAKRYHTLDTVPSHTHFLKSQCSRPLRSVVLSKFPRTKQRRALLQVLAGIAEVKWLDKWFCDAFCYFPTVNVSPESGMGL